MILEILVGQIKTQIKYKHILRNIVDGKTGEPQENGQDLANDNTTNEQQQHITDYNDYINDDVEAIILDNQYWKWLAFLLSFGESIIFFTICNRVHLFIYIITILQYVSMSRYEFLFL